MPVAELAELVGAVRGILLEAYGPARVLAYRWSDAEIERRLRAELGEDAMALLEAAGTCKPGERADLTGCAPATKDAPKERTSAAKPAPKSVAAGQTHQPSVTIKPTKDRVFQGKQVNAPKISKQEAGAIGENIVIAHLQSKGMKDARPMNLDRNNFPIDLVQDHEVIEVKTGQVSNGPGAQQWRLTIGEPGKAEKAWLASASAEEKAAWNERKQQMIHERKKKALADLSKKLGKPVKSATMTVILNPETKTADIYRFEGWHDRIGWNSDAAKKGYLGSMSYASAG